MTIWFQIIRKLSCHFLFEVEIEIEKQEKKAGKHFSRKTESRKKIRKAKMQRKFSYRSTKLFYEEEGKKFSYRSISLLYGKLSRKVFNRSIKTLYS